MYKFHEVDDRVLRLFGALGWPNMDLAHEIGGGCTTTDVALRKKKLGLPAIETSGPKHLKPDERFEAEELAMRRASVLHVFDMRMETGKFPSYHTITMACMLLNICREEIISALKGAMIRGVRTSGKNPWGPDCLSDSKVPTRYHPDPTLSYRSSAAMCMEG